MGTRPLRHLLDILDAVGVKMIAYPLGTDKLAAIRAEIGYLEDPTFTWTFIRSIRDALHGYMPTPYMGFAPLVQGIWEQFFFGD